MKAKLVLDNKDYEYDYTEVKFDRFVNKKTGELKTVITLISKK